MTQLCEDVGVVPRPLGTARLWREWRTTAVQVVLVTAAIVVYFTARGLTQANPTRALGNARDVVAFERWGHLYQEPTLQRLVLGHHGVIDVLNWIYIWGHWPVIVVVLLWLVHDHPERYRVLRNALFVSGCIGIVIFALFPVAPPRLAGLGLVDTVTAQSHAYRVLQPPSFVNQYAAIPSLHVGWNLLVGIFVARHARRPLLRALGVLTPVAMTAAVVLTANHYLIDAALGAMIALAGLAIVARLSPGQ